LYQHGHDGVVNIAVHQQEAMIIIQQNHKGTCVGHFAKNSTAHKSSWQVIFGPLCLAIALNFAGLVKYVRHMVREMYHTPNYI
jgi:hypothetical protein